MFTRVEKLIDHKKFRSWFNLIALCLILFFSFGSYANARNAQDASTHIFVQTVGGKTVEAIAVDEVHREKPIVSRFAQDFMVLGFHWQADIPGTTEEGITYPSAFHAYSWKVDESIRKQWLYGQGIKYEDSAYPMKKFLNGTLNAVVKPAREPIVKQIAEDQWEADVKGSRHFFTKEGKGLNSEILHFRLTLQAKRPITSYRWGKPDTLIGQALNQAQLDGLKVINIVDLAQGVA
ncbi:MAG: hypothetical protein HC768_18625 [Acaryochloris sp. CRU_2_0]|nr:hypothetical protein [Acaryochloris sp. CRU_2_0]